RPLAERFLDEGGDDLVGHLLRGAAEALGQAREPALFRRVGHEPALAAKGLQVTANRGEPAPLAVYELDRRKDRALADAHPFHSPTTHGFVRVAAATPVVHTADPAANAEEHVALIKRAAAEGVELLLFPELSLSAYAIDDLVMQGALLDEVERQIGRLAPLTAETGLVAVVGAPLRRDDRLYNCAVVLGNGRVLGVVPKTYLPNYREYYEKRWFSAGGDVSSHDGDLTLGEDEVPFGTDLLFEAADRPGFVFGVEICEDYWAPLPPSTRQALSGARILLNLSASNIVIG